MRGFKAKDVRSGTQMQHSTNYGRSLAFIWRNGLEQSRKGLLCYAFGWDGLRPSMACDTSIATTVKGKDGICFEVWRRLTYLVEGKGILTKVVQHTGDFVGFATVSSQCGFSDVFGFAGRRFRHWE